MSETNSVRCSLAEAAASSLGAGAGELIQEMFSRPHTLCHHNLTNYLSHNATSHAASVS